MTSKRIAVIGGGNIGKALIEGLIAHGNNPGNIFLIEVIQSKRKQLEETFKITSSERIDNSIKKCSAVIIAVKPREVKEILKNLAPFITENHLIISIAAGISIDFIEKELNKTVSIVRTMPNIAAQVGKAAVALCHNNSVTRPQLKTAHTIMKCIGSVIDVEERQMDAITGLSGSGPAFVFLMIEALADGGVLMGLTREKSLELAVLTVYGSASYLKELKVHPSLAKELVTTPGGTTIEGILLLEEGGFKGLIMNAVKYAAEKSSRLGAKNNG